MPAAPATHPSPKIGMRFRFTGSRIRFISRASTDGLAMPVTDTKKIAPRALLSSPARSSAVPRHSSLRSTATRIQWLLAVPQLVSPGYSSIGSAMCRVSTPTRLCSRSTKCGLSSRSPQCARNALSRTSWLYSYFGNALATPAIFMVDSDSIAVWRAPRSRGGYGGTPASDPAGCFWPWRSRCPAARPRPSAGARTAAGSGPSQP